MTPTGIEEVDKLLTGMVGLEPMIIDKVQFDNVILPLLRSEVLPVDESFEHLKTLWMNYHKSQFGESTFISDGTDESNNISRRPSALSVPMKIVDENGEVVGITPALVANTTIPGSTEIFNQYKSELNHNPAVAKIKLLNTFKHYKVDNSQEWIDFLDNYEKPKEEVFISSITDDFIIG